MKSKGRDEYGGVVTFLDVLGWRGVYFRQNNAIKQLAALLSGLSLRAEHKRGALAITVIGISDTIALFTRATAQEASDVIEAHGELCQWVIPESIGAELPMRGATAFGAFEMRDKMFVGKAVDEAASWHEHADWIGVHLTPSAEYVFEPSKGGSAWVKYRPATKFGLSGEPHCVNWTEGWADRAKRTRRIKDKFRRLGPIVPEIAGKFDNTLDFIERMTS